MFWESVQYTQTLFCTIIYSASSVNVAVHLLKACLNEILEEKRPLVQAEQTPCINSILDALA